MKKKVEVLRAYNAGLFRGLSIALKIIKQSKSTQDAIEMIISHADNVGGIIAK